MRICLARPIQLLVFCVALALVACSPTSQVSPPTATIDPSPTSQAAELAWSLTLEVSGGIMGLDRVVMLSYPGALEVIDVRRGKQVQVELARDTMLRLDDLVSAIQDVQPEMLPPCADCFVYDLRLERNGHIISATLNDINLDGSSLAPLVDALFDLSKEALPL